MTYTDIAAEFIKADHWHSITSNYQLSQRGISLTAIRSGRAASFRAVHSQQSANQMIPIELDRRGDGKTTPGWGIDNRVDFIVLLYSSDREYELGYGCALLLQPEQIAAKAPIWIARYQGQAVSFAGTSSYRVWVHISELKKMAVRLSRGTNERVIAVRAG